MWSQFALQWTVRCERSLSRCQTLHIHGLLVHSSLLVCFCKKSTQCIIELTTLHCFVCFVWWFIARRCLCAICSIYNLGDRWRPGKGKNHLSVLFSNASTLPSCRYFIDTWKVSQVCIWRSISSWIDTIIGWQEEMPWIHVGFLFQNLKLGYSEELTRQIVPNHFRICWLRTDPRTTTWEMSRECRTFSLFEVNRSESFWMDCFQSQA
jgi:hypothetical protein